VVSRAIIVVAGSVVFFIAVFLFGSDVIGVVTIIICGDSHWWVFIGNGAGRKGTLQKEKGQFIV